MSNHLNSDAFGQLEPRYIGPIGNRVSAVAGIPGNHLIYYAGAASGGIFKTTDGGVHWDSIFDDQAATINNKPLPAKVSSIGALAVSESNPNIVWAGTGESWMRGPISIGNGIYKSIDGGTTWTHMGLEESGRFSKIVIHPTNPDIVWAGAVGSCYGPSNSRGVFKTTDGGINWKRVLHNNDETGCSDISLDPNNPAILYAGMWQFKLRSWIRVSGGPGSGIYKSIDGGENWKELTKGLPTEGKKHQVGKISVNVAGSDSNYVYASIETGDGVPTWDFPNPGNGQLWQSTDAGATWQVKSYDRSINARPAYYTRNLVSPDNKQEVYFFGPSLVTTVDGGENLVSKGYPEAPGVDHHCGWVDPTNGDRMIVASDTGISITQNRGKTWYKINLPISQIYHVSTDNEIPYNVFGNCQDRAVFWGTSNCRSPYSIAQGDADPGVISRGYWFESGPGNECGYSIPDRKNQDYIWSSGSADGPNGGTILLINRKTHHWRTITVYPRFTTGTAPKDVTFRFHWHLPLVVSKHDYIPKSDLSVAFVGSQFVHISIDGGQSWQIISDELTGYDENFLNSSGGLTGDNLNVRMAYTISFMAESPGEPGILWVGTSDQRLWLGKMGKGKPNEKKNWTWQELTKTVSGLPEPIPGAWALVSCIIPSKHEAGTAYISYDKHQANDPNPYIFKLSKYGKKWTKITNGIPASVVSYVHSLAEDPKHPGLLFCGTENALYVTFDDGQNWQVLPGLPPAPISTVLIQDHFSDLVLSTFGRGFWIYDDITPLRQLAKLSAETAFLFEMTRPAYRFIPTTERGSIQHDNDPSVGRNPQSPAPINFYLPSASDKVSITILKGRKVARKLKNIKGIKGINRFWWDMESEPTKIIKLRTNPTNQIGIKYCPSGVRPYSNPVVGNSLSYLLPPGDYTVQLEVDGKAIKPTQSLTLLKDPYSLSSVKDIESQTKLSIKVCDLLNAVVDDINQIEYVRYQIEELMQRIDNKKVKALLDKTNMALLKVEEELFQRNLTGQGEDLARFPLKLVANLVYLGQVVGTGDFKPTDQQEERYEELANSVNHQHKELSKEANYIMKKINPVLQKAELPILLLHPPDSPICGLFDTGPAF